jgi:hypothetical protein
MPLKYWYNSYLVAFLIKFILSLIQFIHIRRESCSSLAEVRATEKVVRHYQLMTYIYANAIFVGMLAAGNMIYFNQEPTHRALCHDVSAAYTQLNSLTLLLLVFGYAQGLYYLTIWFSVVCMKCHGKDPMAHDSDAEAEDEQNAENERAQRNQILRAMRVDGVEDLGND